MVYVLAAKFALIMFVPLIVAVVEAELELLIVIDSVLEDQEAKL